MKKIVALVLACVMLMALVACGAAPAPAAPAAAPAAEAPAAAAPAEEAPAAEATNYPTPENPLTLKLGHVGPPKSSLDESAQYIANYINEKTNGAIVIEVYPQGQLGDAIVMMDGLTNGTLECAMVGANEIATMIPDFYALCLPFLFNDFPEFFTIAQDEKLVSMCNDLTAAKGFQTLGFTSGIARGFNNTKRPIHVADDCAGLKIRIMAGSIYVDIFEALGCTTSTMAFGECYSALQQGVIDGEDNDADMMVTMKFMEVEKYHTELNCTVQSNPLLVSNEYWNMLSPEQQQIFRDAVADWCGSYIEFFKTSQAERLATLEENGVDIVYPTAEEKDTFKEATAAVYEKYSADINPDFMNYVLEKVDEYRAG